MVSPVPLGSLRSVPPFRSAQNPTGKVVPLPRYFPRAIFRSAMSSSTLSQHERKSWIADTGRRRSMRVLLSVPVTIAGKLNNQDFAEDTRTLVVNAHGALVSLAATAAVGQTITISNKMTRHAHECRIVHVGSHQAGRSQIGIEFLKPSPSFWQIDFPPDDWIVPEN
jgi:hypothetical protein